MSRLGRRLLRAARHPARTARGALRRISGQPRRSGRSPDDLFRNYGRLARRQGFKGLYVLLSLDCDTPEDAEAAEQLTRRLRERGIKATCAVPGEQLRQNADVYRRIAQTGAEFINHGARPHAEWRDGAWRSVTFYHEMPPEEIAADVRGGHDILREVLGIDAIGFRAPHFGNFQAPEQREVVYRALRELGYRFSTSTLPGLALEHGPLINVDGLWEIPLSGSYAHPRALLDSWNHVASPEHPVVTDEYAQLFIATVERLLAMSIPGVLNYYVDPAHVAEAEPFHRAMARLQECRIGTVDFQFLLRAVKGPLP